MTTSSSDLFAGVVPFVATAEARSFRVAARGLGVTPSALSKAVAKLESELGVTLLHRTSRSVQLTAEGEAFLVRCQAAIGQVRAGRDQAAHSHQAVTGRLHVSLPVALGTRLVVPALPTLMARHPGLSVHVSLTDRFADLAAESIDVVVRLGTTRDSRAIQRKLGHVRWVTAASPAYLAHHGVPASPDDLATHNCLHFILPDGLPKAWEFRSGNLPSLSGTFTSDSGEALVQATVAGLGLVQAHSYMVADAIAHGQLVEVLRSSATPGPVISLLFAPGRHDLPRCRAFGDFITELLATSR